MYPTLQTGVANSVDESVRRLREVVEVQSVENVGVKNKMTQLQTQIDFLKTRLGHFEELIELSDVVKTESDWNKVKEFFAKLREEKELK